MMAQAIVVDRRRSPMGQLLGYGGKEAETVYTRERLQKLCELETPRVNELQRYLRKYMPHSELLRCANRMRMAADILNERIDADAIGGNGGCCEPYRIELPAARVLRVDLNLCARKVCREIRDGCIGGAVTLCRQSIAQLIAGGIDI